MQKFHVPNHINLKAGKAPAWPPPKVRRTPMESPVDRPAGLIPSPLLPVKFVNNL
jgi:hypothetical protein